MIIGREELEYARRESERNPRQFFIYSKSTDFYEWTDSPSETDQIIFDPRQILGVCKYLTIEEENEILKAVAFLKILKEVSQ